MSIPAAGFPLAARISPRLQIVDHTGSTNSDLVRRAAEEPAAYPHLSVLLTEDQQSGRGRLDRRWTAPRGASLAVSTIVDASSLPPAARGWIPLIAGAAMTRAIDAQLAGSGRHARLKWPNDVLVHPALRDGGAKMCGILAEVVPGLDGVVVVGSGVNVAMTLAQRPVPTAASFRAVGIAPDLDRMLADYLEGLDTQLRALVAAGGDAEAAGVHGGISALCATIGADVAVSLPDGTRLTGRARGLGADGRLVVVDSAGVETVVSAGDVVHVR